MDRLRHQPPPFLYLRELSRVIENKIWLQKMTDYFSRPWSEVEKENGDNGPEMAVSVVTTVQIELKNIVRVSSAFTCTFNKYITA